MKQHYQLLSAAMTDHSGTLTTQAAADHLRSAVAPNLTVAGVVLLALLLPVGARAQHIGTTTACKCFAFEDAKSKPIQLLLLAKSTLMKATGAHISSPWGIRMHPIRAYPAMHWGVDIAAPEGTPIFAAASGIIEEAREKGELGNFVRVRHSKTLATAYAHLSHFAPGIRPGIQVTRGQVIAYVGSTGLTTGPHLHFQVFLDECRIRVICACVAQDGH